MSAVRVKATGKTTERILLNSDGFISAADKAYNGRGKRSEEERVGKMD